MRLGSGMRVCDVVYYLVRSKMIIIERHVSRAPITGSEFGQERD